MVKRKTRSTSNKTMQRRLQHNLVNLNSPKTRSNCTFRSAKFSDKFNSANQILGVSTVLFASLGSSSKRGLQTAKRLNPELKPPPTELFFFAISLGFHSNNLWLAERKSRHFLNQSEVISKQLVTRLHAFPALNARNMYFTRFLSGSLDCWWRLWLDKVLSLDSV